MSGQRDKQTNIHADRNTSHFYWDQGNKQKWKSCTRLLASLLQRKLKKTSVTGYTSHVIHSMTTVVCVKWTSSAISNYQPKQVKYVLMMTVMSYVEGHNGAVSPDCLNLDNACSSVIALLQIFA